MLATGAGEELEKFKEWIKRRNEMRNQGENPVKYVGIELQSLSGGGLRLHQSSYIETISKRYAQERLDGVLPKRPMERRLLRLAR
jgi:hypothetical protein